MDNFAVFINNFCKSYTSGEKKSYNKTRSTRYVRSDARTSNEFQRKGNEKEAFIVKNNESVILTTIVH